MMLCDAQPRPYSPNSVTCIASSLIGPTPVSRMLYDLVKVIEAYPGS